MTQFSIVESVLFKYVCVCSFQKIYNRQQLGDYSRSFAQTTLFIKELQPFKNDDGWNENIMFNLFLYLKCAIPMRIWTLWEHDNMNILGTWENMNILGTWEHEYFGNMRTWTLWEHENIDIVGTWEHEHFGNTRTKTLWEHDNMNNVGTWEYEHCGDMRTWTLWKYEHFSILKRNIARLTETT